MRIDGPGESFTFQDFPLASSRANEDGYLQGNPGASSVMGLLRHVLPPLGRRREPRGIVRAFEIRFRYTSQASFGNKRGRSSWGRESLVSGSLHLGDHDFSSSPSVAR